MNLSFALLICWSAAAPAHAQTDQDFYVDTTLDISDADLEDGECLTPEGYCTLRAAIEQNNAMPRPTGPWRLIHLPAGVYALTLDELEVSEAVAILGEGPSSTWIDANEDRAFHVHGEHISSFSNLTIQNAQSNSGNSGLPIGRGGGIYVSTPETHLNLYRVHMVRCSTDWRGGGIYNMGSMTIQEGKFERCKAPRSDGSGETGKGGAIWSDGSMQIYSSEFTANEGTRGGAIYNEEGAMEITNSTFYQNRVTYQGGAIGNKASSPNGYMKINFSTITGNTTWVETNGVIKPFDAWMGGGGIHNIGTLRMGNSLVAGNVDLAPVVSTSPDCWSIDHEDRFGQMVFPTFTSYRSNIVGELNPENCDMRDYFWGDQRSDHVGLKGDPLPTQLGSFSLYGGLTATLPPLPGGLAIDGAPSRSGNSVFPCPERDQRGVPRPETEPCDIGAFEVVAQTTSMEAEDASFHGAYHQIAVDAAASGGKYVYVPSNLPNYLDAPNEQQRLEFDIYIESAGNYHIQGYARVFAPDHNSFWVRVDGMPEEPYLWDLQGNGASFLPEMLSHRGNGDEENPESDNIPHYFSRGMHTITVYLRENFTQLDRIEILPVTSSFQALEVETSAFLHGAFMVGNDPQASNSRYVFTPAGMGNFLDGPNESYKLTQVVEVDQAGTYLIRAGVFAEFDDRNSFYVKVNGLPEEGYLWDMTETNTTYGTDYVSHRGSGDSRNPELDPVEIYLPAGTHTIEVFAREAGTRLDNIGLELKQDADAKIISRHKPAFSSSDENGSLTPGKAVDGNPATRWSSQFSDNQWIKIDLQGTYDLHRVVLNWEWSHAEEYEIQVSDDGWNWTTLYHKTGSTGGIDNLMVDGTGRFVRMKGIKRSTPWGYSLWEFDVYGVPAEPGSGGFVCQGGCLDAETVVEGQTAVLNTTGDRWFVVEEEISGWQASEIAGRTIHVNGVQVQPGQFPLPGKVAGKYYFHFTSGSHAWASWSFWNY